MKNTKFLKQTIINYVCILYAIIFPYFYQKLLVLSTRTFEIKWQYWSLALLFILSMSIVILIKVNLKCYSISNFFVFGFLLFLRYRYFFIFNRIDFIYMSILFTLMIIEVSKIINILYKGRAIQSKD